VSPFLVAPQIQKRSVLERSGYDGEVLLSSMHSHMEACRRVLECGANTGKVVHLNVMLITNGCKVSLLSVLLDSFISFSLIVWSFKIGLDAIGNLT